MFAVVRTGGKQYRVAAGDKIAVEKLAGEAGETITLGDVLLAGDGGEIQDAKGVVVSAEIIAQAKSEKVIVFTEFREIQRALQRYIGERFGLTVTVINGDTTVQAGSDRSRQARIDAFQAAPGFGVIVLSTTAVGFGVNVQAANHVIHFTRPWNPAKEDQATDRAYRIGQTRPVTVYCPTVTAPNFITFEAKLDTLLRAKRELARDMLNGAEDIRPDDWQDF